MGFTDLCLGQACHHFDTCNKEIRTLDGVLHNAEQIAEETCV